MTPLLLPQASHAVVIEYLIVGDDRQVFDLGLSDQHPIEGIAMRAWKPAGSLRVKHRDVQAFEALTGEAASDVGGHLHRARQLTDPHFGGNLPGRCRAYEDRIAIVAKRVTRAARQTPIAVQPP